MCGKFNGKVYYRQIIFSGTEKSLIFLKYATKLTRNLKMPIHLGY